MDFILSYTVRIRLLVDYEYFYTPYYYCTIIIYYYILIYTIWIWVLLVTIRIWIFYTPYYYCTIIIYYYILIYTIRWIVEWPGSLDINIPDDTLEQPLILALQSSLAAAAGVSAAAVKVELPPPPPGRRLRTPEKTGEPTSWAWKNRWKTHEKYRNI